MTHIRLGALAIALAATATTAGAFPVQTDASYQSRPAMTPQLVVNGYGPSRNGIYGRHRHHRGRSYGTGYHGRGTRTGGPVGGLPSRN